LYGDFFPTLNSIAEKKSYSIELVCFIQPSKDGNRTLLNQSQFLQTKNLPAQLKWLFLADNSDVPS
jgi:hypothetical protein